MANISTSQTRVFRHGQELTDDVWRALDQHEAPANLILPCAKKAVKLPREDKDNLWIVQYDDANNVEFVLSCTVGPLGKNYPIFILSCKSSVQLVQEEKHGKGLVDTLSPLVLCLLGEVPPQRVFSVMSIAIVTVAFAELFEAHAGGSIERISEPYYDATFTFCTIETLKKSPDSLSYLQKTPEVSISLRPANMSHLEGVQAICKAFSETSPPFVLDDASAELEARLMIANKQAWVHLVQRPGQKPEIACLVATTRESENVTAITKVFTSEDWRGHKCAERLMHRVCQDVLQQKKRVVLYVGNTKELEPARKLYHKVGFQGLDGRQVKDVEKWLEIGFTNTDLGYW